MYIVGVMSSEVMKEESGLYGSPGADLVAMGDQVMQEDGGNMGGASSWDQYSTAGRQERRRARSTLVYIHVHDKQT